MKSLKEKFKGKEVKNLKAIIGGNDGTIKKRKMKKTK